MILSTNYVPATSGIDESSALDKCSAIDENSVQKKYSRKFSLDENSCV